MIYFIKTGLMFGWYFISGCLCTKGESGVKIADSHSEVMPHRDQQQQSFVGNWPQIGSYVTFETEGDGTWSCMPEQHFSKISVIFINRMITSALSVINGQW